MSDEIPGRIQVTPHEPVTVDNFRMNVAADNSVKLEFLNEGKVVAIVDLSEGFATFLAGYLAPETRKQVWQQARDAFYKSRH